MMIYWMGIQTIMSSSAILSNSSSPSGHTTAIYNRATRGNIRIKSVKLNYFWRIVSTSTMAFKMCASQKRSTLHLMTCTGNIPPLCSVDSQIFHPWPIWSGHSKHSRAEEQPSCWLEVSRKGNPSIFSVGYCQLINREIGASSSLNTLSTHSTHFLAAENTIFIYTILSQYKPFYGLIISASHTERVVFVPTLFVVGEVVVVVAQESPLDWVCLGLGHSNRGGVGHRGHGGCWEHQGWHVNTVTHRPENSVRCRTELN